MLTQQLFLLLIVVFSVFGSKLEDSKSKKNFYAEELPEARIGILDGAKENEARYSVDPKFKADCMDMDLLKKCTILNLQFAGEDIEILNFQSGKHFEMVENGGKSDFTNERINFSKTEMKKKFVKEISNILNELALINETTPTESIKNEVTSAKKSRSKAKSKAKAAKAKSEAQAEANNANDPKFETLNSSFAKFDAQKTAMEKFSNTLNHPHCLQAIDLCGFKSFDQRLTTQLVIQYPEVMKNHLKFVFELKDFSFLTPLLAIELFSSRNFLFNPFAIEALVKSVTLEVLVALLELWEYDLTFKDAKLVMEIWRKREEFLKIVEEDPRSWLLWYKLNLPKDFPIETLEKVQNLKNIFLRYINLLIAVNCDIEFKVFQSLYNLQTIFIKLNNEIWINNKASDDLNITSPDATVQAQVWDLWFKEGNDEFIKIIQQFKLKQKLISFVLNLIPIVENFECLRCVKIISLFLRIPFNPFGRIAYSQSQDKEKLLKAQSNINVFSFHLAPKTEFWNWSDDKFDFWALMWNKLEFTSGIKTCYNSFLSNPESMSAKVEKLIFHLIEIYKYLKFGQRRMISWPIFMTLMIMKPSTNFYESNFYIKTIESFTMVQGREFEEDTFEYLKLILAPESVEKFIKFIDYHDAEFEKFKLAPETLSRDQIKTLIKNPNMRDLMLSHSSKVMKLRTLIDFTTEDLLEFFPVFDSEFHLELHDSLHTANPEALIGYLRRVEGTLNYPERFAWSVHPVVWNYSEFVDLMADNIPFSSLVYYPNESESLNLIFAVCDIMGRIDRCNGNSLEIQKQIIKWTINMEWIFNQFYISNSTQELYGHTAQVYKKFFNHEIKSRKELIEYLKTSSEFETGELLKIVESVPLSYIRLSMCYVNFLVEAHTRIQHPKFISFFNGVFNQFSAFVGKKHSEVKIMELEQRISENVEICHGLIQKHFNSIEKITWENRLSVSTFISFKRFDSHSKVPVSYLNEPHVPVFNVLIYMKIFEILNFGNQNQNQEFIQYAPDSIDLVRSKIKNYEDFIMITRTALLENDLAIRRFLLLSGSGKNDSKK